MKILTFFLQLDEQAEAIELANSVLIEVRLFGFLTFSQLQFFLFLAITISSLQISKASVKNWQSKLQTRYGWFKKENCKNIIFDVSISFRSYKATAPSCFMIKIKALLWRFFSDLMLNVAS